MSLNNMVRALAGQDAEVDEAPPAKRDDFVVGARVSWTERKVCVGGKGTSIRFNERNGRIEAFDGEVALIPFRGQRRRIHWTKLRLAR